MYMYMYMYMYMPFTCIHNHGSWEVRSINSVYTSFFSISSCCPLFFFLFSFFQVQHLMGDVYNNSAVQKQVLNLYDQVYQSYVMGNSTKFNTSSTHPLQRTDLLNELTTIVIDNLETVLSVSSSHCPCNNEWIIIQ